MVPKGTRPIICDEHKLSDASWGIFNMKANELHRGMRVSTWNNPYYLIFSFFPNKLGSGNTGTRRAKKRALDDPVLSSYIY